ncbi:DNA-binding protein [Streptomyces scopuliridis]|uniref:DNA-binding protein n=1 Tax=Streptomyces scopuliridis TaxID=452529 RepID=UPI0036A454AE
MSAEKVLPNISVSTPSELLGALRTRSGKRGVSAYVTAAVRHQPTMDGLAEIVASYEAEHEPLSETEVQAAQRDLFGLQVQDVTQADSLTAVQLLSDAGGPHGHKHAIDAFVAAMALRSPAPVLELTSDRDDWSKLCGGRVQIKDV